MNAEGQQFVAKHPGLQNALEQKHKIIQDIRRRLERYGTLSDKQVELVFRLAAEANAKRVPAPISDVPITFTGTFLSAKYVPGRFGDQAKMTIRVDTPEGSWMAYGTCPAGMLDGVPAGEKGRFHAARGAQVEVTARLKPSDEVHFAYLSKPRARILKLADGALPGEENTTDIGDDAAAIPF